MHLCSICITLYTQRMYAVCTNQTPQRGRTVAEEHVSLFKTLWGFCATATSALRAPLTPYDHHHHSIYHITVTLPVLLL